MFSRFIQVVVCIRYSFLCVCVCVCVCVSVSVTNTLLYIHTTSCLSRHPSVGIYVPTFWLLWIVLLWTLVIQLNRHHKKNKPTKKKWANRPFSKKDIQMANKHIKRCAPSLVIKKMQIKTIRGNHFTSSRIAIVTTKENNKCWWACEEIRNPRTLPLGMPNCGSCTGKQFGGSSEC